MSISSFGVFLFFARSASIAARQSSVVSRSPSVRSVCSSRCSSLDYHSSRKRSVSGDPCVSLCVATSPRVGDLHLRPASTAQRIWSSPTPVPLQSNALRRGMSASPELRRVSVSGLSGDRRPLPVRSCQGRGEKGGSSVGVYRPSSSLLKSTAASRARDRSQNSLLDGGGGRRVSSASQAASPLPRVERSNKLLLSRTSQPSQSQHQRTSTAIRRCRSSECREARLAGKDNEEAKPFFKRGLPSTLHSETTNLRSSCGRSCRCLSSASYDSRPCRSASSCK